MVSSDGGRPDTGFLSAPADWTIGAAAGITTRRGGVSQGHLAEANYSLRVGDDPERVAENWRRIQAATGLPLVAAAGLALEHGVRVHEVDAPGGRLPGDGLVTTKRNLALALTVADCLPLALSAPQRGVALVHCGWRGIAAGIAERAVAALSRAAASPRDSLDAWIGPGIGPCCFTLSSDEAGAFPSARLEHSSRSSSASRSVSVDLAGSLRDALSAAGLSHEKIRITRLCTSCEPERFYSHRRDKGETGRMLAWVVRL
ncbi:MAG: laccase domain-containing protein [Candidatus Eisenbacteria bacterium]|nr:laccase domain-containing protein [Candidatus Eisenbacteria bacterium]